jgi:phosphoribosyl 1,2-cyclic phosphodiesterase
MRLTVWGCRGSVPTPGSRSVRYGGNTSCVEVSCSDDTLLVLDAGTGIRALGDDLVKRGARRIHLLLTHLHLDHLEGLRFFAPLWDERVAVELWGPPSPVASLQERVARAFSPPLFPIELRDIPAQVTFRDVPREPWAIADARLSAALVVHPGPTVGFRIEHGRSTFAYVPDHEPALTGIARRPSEWISGASVAQGADVLFHDAQYFREEYERRIGWGHSSVDDAVAFTRSIGARRLVLFHHEPAHSDDELERLEARAAELGADDLEATTAAREGMVLDLA